MRDYFPQGNSILIFAPHNDDEILAVGGVIQRYVNSTTPVQIALLTNGDGQVRRLPLPTPPLYKQNFLKLGYKRQNETLNAVNSLGLNENNVNFLGYPDQGLSKMWTTNWTCSNLYYSQYTGTNHSPYENSYTKGTPYCGTAVIEDIKRMILEVLPDIVYLPHPNDLHPDHWATNGFVASSLEQLKHEGYSQLDNIKMISYLVHSIKFPQPRGKYLNKPLRVPNRLENLDTEWIKVPLGYKERQLKLKAIGEHRTQIRLMRKYLMSFARANELFGIVPTLSLNDSAKYKTNVVLPPEEIKKQRHKEPLISYLGPRPKQRLTGLRPRPNIESVTLTKKSRKLNLVVEFSSNPGSANEIRIIIKPFKKGKIEGENSHLFRYIKGKLHHNDETETGDPDRCCCKCNQKSFTLSIPLEIIGIPEKIILSVVLARRGVTFLRTANRLIKI